MDSLKGNDKWHEIVNLSPAQTSDHILLLSFIDRGESLLSGNESACILGR